MYQLGLSPATAEVPSMSAVALGANRWASRVVVVLQLAAWSAVGIVLLQKGVSSLQKTPLDVRNVTKANYTETTLSNLMMNRIGGVEEGEEAPGDLLPEDIRDHRDSVIKVRDEIAGGMIPAVIPLARLTPNHLPVNEKSSNPEKDLFEGLQNLKNNFHVNNDNDDNNDDNEEDDPLIETTTLVYRSTITPLKYDKIFEARKKLRMSNLSGGGAAAAAVAMIAVGAVMLVLGPVVIILRALDERRQERRFLKLSGQDDLPPSYEQATLMDEAPRYSTLSLNTINCSTVLAPGTGSSSNDNNHSAIAEAGGVREV